MARKRAKTTKKATEKPVEVGKRQLCRDSEEAYWKEKIAACKEETDIKERVLDIYIECLDDIKFAADRLGVDHPAFIVAMKDRFMLTLERINVYHEDQIFLPILRGLDRQRERKEQMADGESSASD